MRFLAAFAMRGRLQALTAICGLALGSLLLFPLSLLSSAMLALVALRQEVKTSASILLLALLALGLVGALTGNALQAVLYGMWLWLPMWPMAVVLRETRKLEWAMEAALGLGLLAVLIVYLLVDEPAALWREFLQIHVRPLLEGAAADADSADMAQQALEFSSHYLTGATAGWSVMIFTLGLLMARWLQSVLFNPGGFRSEFVALRLHQGVAYATVACVAAGVLGHGGLAELAWNMSIVFSMVFTIAGFAVLHAVLGSKGFWIAGIYVALLFMPQFLLLPIALVGASDNWLDWRKYAKRL